MYDFTQLEGWRTGWQKPERMPIDQWLRRVSLGNGYAIQGPFRVETSRYLLEPLRCIQDDTVREADFLAAIQMGKTLIPELGIDWASVNSPGLIMWTMQSDEDAKEQCETRTMEMLKGTPEFRALMSTDRHKNRTTELILASHAILVNGANKNNLQSKSVKWKFNSELWLWKEGLLDMAKGRVSAYARVGTSKIFNESQASEEGTDWHRQWLGGDQAEWSIECHGCGQYSPLAFFGRMNSDPKIRACVVWDQEAGVDASSTWNIQRAAETARWKCPHCGHEHADTARTRALWNKTGKYISANPDAPKSHRSFHVNSLPAHSMAELVIMWGQACEQRKVGNLEPMKNFYLQRLAEWWKADEEKELIELVSAGYKLTDILENPKELVVNEAHRFMTIDRQRDHFWVIIRAWRADGSSRLLWRGKTLTIEQNRELQERFNIQPQLTFEDGQYDTGKVYEDCIKYGWTALHGSGEDSFPITLQNGAKVRRLYTQVKSAQVPGGAARYMHWASDPIKDMLHRLRSNKWHKWETPDDADEPGSGKLAYSRQLNGDQKRERVNKGTGKSEWRWVKVSDNHFADCEAMQVVAACALQVLKIEDQKEA